MPRSQKFFIFSILLQACLLLGLFSRFFGFTFDSMVYVSTAQNIHLGAGLRTANFFIEKSPNDFVPLDMEPPGFPVLIALMMQFGFNSFAAGLLVPHLCFLFLPLLFYLVFKRILSDTQAMIAAILSALMFSVVQCAMMAWSDLPCLVFSLLALLVFFHLIEKRGEVSFGKILLAGILAGIVYLIRFVGISLIFSLGVGLILAVLIKLISRRNFLKVIFLYAMGVAIVVLPYIYRNWHLFGRIQSYAAASSRVPLARNILDYLDTVAGMLFGASSLDGLVVFLLIVLGVFILLRVPGIIKEKPELFIFISILSVYFLTNSIVLIAFRTIWYSFETIDGRYLIQIVWILIMALVFVFNQVLNFMAFRKMVNKKRMIVLLMLVFVVIQIFLSRDFLNYQSKQLVLTKTIKQYIPILRQAPKDMVIVTNYPDLLYYYLQRNIRLINFYTPADLSYFKRKQMVFLLKEGRETTSQWGWYSPWWFSPQGYQKILDNPKVAIFEKNQD